FGEQRSASALRDIHYTPFARGKVRRSALWDPSDVDKPCIRIDASALVLGANNVGEDVSILPGSNNLQVVFTSDWELPGWVNLPFPDYDVAAVTPAQLDHYTASASSTLPPTDLVGRPRTVGPATDAGAFEQP
ncbi:MAG: hypothetical protein ACI9K2_002863, partial [Myxococcota bacterium]